MSIETLKNFGFKPVDDDCVMYETDDGWQVYQDDPDKMDSWFVSGPNCLFSGPFTLPEAVAEIKFIFG